MSAIESSLKNLESAIRNIADFPKPGIQFKDITPILRDPVLFHQSIELLAGPYSGKDIDAVVGIDARGFIFASGVALRLNAGFVPIRKAGKLPYFTLEESYDLEYGSSTIAIHQDALKEGDRVILVDDLLATGGTAIAAIKLLESLKVHIVGISFLIELAFLDARRKFSHPHLIQSLVTYAAE
ncbi:MAG: adenine phosphoribosyltransferase [Verrucomicrobia bacterium]|nr:adenine phosphoribosyltransferase [Verrucomicrobiota bacterium]